MGYNLNRLGNSKFIDKFAETVALNRGGKMYVTGDFPTAEEWLLNSQI